MASLRGIRRRFNESLAKKDLNSRENRIQRTGAAIWEMAEKHGWKDDGEGAIEFLLRLTYETGWDDHARSIKGER